MPADAPHVVVIGAGITGLAAAHELLGAGRPVAVTVLEAAGEPGGKLQGGPFAGLPHLDAGADMVLVRTPAAVDLARAVGLGDELVSPNRVPACVWSGGRLHRLPPGLVLGAPAALGPLARSGLLSWRGKARAAVEPLVPRRDTDDNLGATIRSRFGDEVLDRLVGPLVGGINAGDADRLSLRAVTPQLADALGRHRSLLRGLRSMPRPSGDGAVFVAPRSGVSSIVPPLARAIEAAGGTICCDATVDAVEPRPGGAWTVSVAGRSEPIAADAVVLTAPAPAAAALLRPLTAEAAELLATIAYASVAMVTLALPDDAVRRPLDGTGYLVPRAEQRTITACSWGSSKWDHWRRPGQVLLRVSAGRAGDEQALELDDDGLTSAVLADLDRHLGLAGPPTEVRVTRWRSSMPQYAPGHVERIDRLEGVAADALPGLHLAGAAYRGLGVPACVAQGQAAARAALATIGRRRG
jgi:oxygen-dependent protoporphyrinogen oxidase